MPRIQVTKTSVHLTPDPTRVITKPFVPGSDRSEDPFARVRSIIARIVAMPEAEMAATLRQTEARFEGRHADLPGVLGENFDAVATHAGEMDLLSSDRRLLIGAYLTHEYSIESAALSNPSIVPAPDQSGIPETSLRFILSLRAIGEGHISSITFRAGVIDSAGEIQMEAPGPFARTARHRAPHYDKAMFRGKLNELHADTEVVDATLDLLSDRFTLEQVDAAIQQINQERDFSPANAQVTRTIHWLASSNYDSTFPAESKVNERVLFPAGPAESRGMEDARFVRFNQPDGSVTYYAPYTAFDGYQILPQLIETSDFLSFRIATLNGAAAINKGIALFPRLIDGRYAALSRVDNENNYLMWADNVRFWHDCQLLQQPAQPWEFIQLGNCGSPLETEAGWLVLTHGVGAMRQYAIGAILLDTDDPSRVIGHLSEPLIEPSADERDGYVPNVVYSCGSMIAGNFLVLPYGFSDVGTRIATLRLDDVLTELTRGH